MPAVLRSIPRKHFSKLKQKVIEKFVFPSPRNEFVISRDFFPLNLVAFTQSFPFLEKIVLRDTRCLSTTLTLYAFLFRCEFLFFFFASTNETFSRASYSHSLFFNRKIQITMKPDIQSVAREKMRTS